MSFVVEHQKPLDSADLGKNTSSAESQTEYSDLRNQVVPGSVLGMTEYSFSLGDAVRITSGVFAGAEGIVADLAPACSVVRVHAKTGNAYAYVTDLERVVKPMRVPGTDLLRVTQM